MRNLKTYSIYLFLLSFCLIINSNLYAQSVANTGEQQINSFFNYLYTNEAIELSLTTDINQLIETKKEEIYQPATFQFIDKEGMEQKYEIELRTRGKSRRRICEIPPIKLKFKKEELLKAGFVKHNGFKLVLPCNKEKKSKEYILKEFLGYKMFNELTNQSFRVQLLKIKLFDKKNSELFYEGFGFIIESYAELSKRLNGKKSELYNLQPEDCDLAHLSLVSLFQYMIGNTDWKIQLNHNIKTVEYENDKKKTPIPYDFDYSGLVNAFYAKPNPNYPRQISVRDRIFLGTYNTEASLTQAVEQLKAIKPKIESIYKDCNYSDSKTKKEIGQYLKSFFKEIDHPKFVKRMLKVSKD